MTHNQTFTRSTNRHGIVILMALVVLVPLFLLESRGKHNMDELAFYPPEGSYDQKLTVELAAPSDASRIVYTLDGTIPTKSEGFVYSEPILLGKDTPSVAVIRARAIFADGSYGEIANASYFLGLQAELPILSLIVNPDDFWGEQVGIYANPTGRGNEWERPIEVTYLESVNGDQTPQITFHVPAGVRIHGGTTRKNAPKKSLRLYFRQEYGLNRLAYSFFDTDLRPESIGTYSPELDTLKRLVIHNGGQDYTARNWTLLRIQLMNSLAAKIPVYSTESRPVLVFINGNNQGIYLIRDRIDEWLFADKYGIEKVDMVDTPFVPTTSQDSVHWEHLVKFLETHDLKDKKNYTYVQSQVNLTNFIDYAILQLYAVNNDWLHHNVDQFRPRTQGGQWNWILWDVDYSFGKAWQSFYEFNMIDWLYTETQPNFERGSLLLRKLLENENFRDRFLARTADLLNTTFLPDHVLAQLDALNQELYADIHYETDRWPRTGEWESSVQEMREFIQRRPDAFRQNLIDGFGLNGTEALVFNPPTKGKGRVALNGSLLPESGWQGIFFNGLHVTITAAPELGYRFEGWEITSMATGSPVSIAQTAQLFFVVDKSLTITPSFVKVDNSTPQPGDLTISRVIVDDLGPIEGDWFELVAQRKGGLDLRGWRITDNDQITSTDEGSLIFSNDNALSDIPSGTRILVVATETKANGELFREDDLFPMDGRMIFYVGNEHLDNHKDAWFNLTALDNLVVLAPGPGGDSGTEQGIAMMSLEDGPAVVTPESFGILQDGVQQGMPALLPD